MKIIRVKCLQVFLLISTWLLTACQTANMESITSTAPEPIEVKVVVVTMFELGEDTGDKPGEFQFWKERQALNTRFAFPHSHHDIYMNTETGVMGIVTGMGTAKSTAAIMALGLDSRFDFTNSYWLVAGISGFDPNDASLGSGAWARWLVDGDLAHEIDAREIPENWTTGYFPLFATEPYAEKPGIHQGDSAHKSNNGEVYQLNTELTQWAYDLTKDVELMDTPGIQQKRQRYKNYPNAQRPPFILIGDQVAAMTYWHGKLMNDWANEWTDYWTDGEGEFVSSAMEDTGIYLSLQYLTQAGKAQVDRLMVLRTASNFTMPEDGVSAADNNAQESGGYTGMIPSLETAYRAGSAVVDYLVDNWSSVAAKMPYE